MATIIVGHEGTDMDCVVSMMALATALREVVGYSGDIQIVFIPQGTTYKRIQTDPGHQYEQVGGDRVYHVDCGGGYLDHHRAGCNTPSSALLVDRAFSLSEKVPEWERLIEWATRADQGNLRGCTLAAIVRGEHRRLGPDHDLEVFRFARRMVEALLASERIRVAADRVQAKIVEELQVPKTTPFLQVEEIPDFGRIGLIVGPEEFGGSLRNRLEVEHECRLIISFGTEEGKVGIMSCFPNNGDPVDLRKLGIVSAIRWAEAEARGLSYSTEVLSATGDVPGMKWFAHEVEDGRIANLFCGSAKAPLAEDDETRLPQRLIIQIVKDCITASVAAEK